MNIFSVAPTTSPQVFDLRGIVGTCIWFNPAAGSWTIEYSMDGVTFLPISSVSPATAYTEICMYGGVDWVRITPSTTSGGTFGIRELPNG